MTTPGVRAAFLDRDGTLNVRAAEHEYVTSVEQFRWLDGAPQAVAALARGGFAVAVVSNQRGVARGLMDEGVLSQIEQRIQADLADLGCQVDAFRYCLHDLDAGCECRKPQPGMLRALARERGYDLARSWMIGDTASDVCAGRRAGCHTALVSGAADEARADVAAASLADTVEQILSLEGAGTGS